MLEGKMDFPSLQFFQAIIKVSLAKDFKELFTLQAKLATKAIATFEKQLGTHTHAFPSLDVPLVAATTYFADVFARSTR